MRLPFLLVVLLALSGTTSAQRIGEGLTARFDRAKGLVLERDSLFKMTVRFRMQNRFALLSTSGDDLTIGSSDIRIRRMRLRFDGFVLSPKIQYKVQLGFSKADMDLVDGTVAQPIRDAVGIYAPDAHWSFTIGQTKLPGNRQRVVSSGALQLPDRSIVNAAFTLDRDYGVFAGWQGRIRTHELAVKAALTSGEGRNASPGDDGLCYTGRLEWLPFGGFTDEGDYFEGDLAQERSVKLAVAAGYSANIHARRAGGQLGEFFPDGQARTLNTFIADALLKFRGLAVTTEFCHREVVGQPVVMAADGGSVLALEGWGWNAQLSKLLGPKNEVVGRYSLVVPSARLMGSTSQREEGWLGYTRYINHHRVKMQGAVSYAWTEGQAAVDTPGARWGGWLQVELGI